MLHNTKHMIFFSSYVLIALIILQMMGHERKEHEFQKSIEFFLFIFFYSFSSFSFFLLKISTDVGLSVHLKQSHLQPFLFKYSAGCG